MRHAPLPAAILLGALALAGAAAAQPADQNVVGEVVVVAPRAKPVSPDVVVRSKVVSWGDLDLTNRFEARELLARVHTAARQVCGPMPAPIELAENVDRYACIDAATDRGLDNVHEAILGGPY